MKNKIINNCIDWEKTFIWCPLTNNILAPFINIKKLYMNAIKVFSTLELAKK